MINLKATNRVRHGSFSIRRYASGKEVRRRILVLDDDLIGDAAICALRARTIDGTLNPVELILLGFDVEDYEKLHACRGEFYTNREFDLSFYGIVKTGGGKELQEFIGNIFKAGEGCDNSVLGYSAEVCKKPYSCNQRKRCSWPPVRWKRSSFVRTLRQSSQRTGRPFNSSISENLQSLVHQVGMGCDHTATITAMMDRAILGLASD